MKTILIIIHHLGYLFGTAVGHAVTASIISGLVMLVRWLFKMNITWHMFYDIALWIFAITFGYAAIKYIIKRWLEHKGNEMYKE